MAAATSSNWLTKLIAGSILLLGAGTASLVIFGEDKEQPANSPSPTAAVELTDADVQRLAADMDRIAPPPPAVSAPTDPQTASQADAPASEPVKTVAAAPTALEQAQADLKAKSEEAARLAAELKATKAASEAVEQDRKALATRLATEQSNSRTLLERATTAELKLQRSAGGPAVAAAPAPSLPPKLPAPAVAKAEPAPQVAAKPKTMWEYLPPSAEASAVPSTEDWRQGAGYALPTANPPASSGSGWNMATKPAGSAYTPTLELAQADRVWIRTSPTKTDAVRIGERHPTCGVLQTIQGKTAKFENCVIHAPAL